MISERDHVREMAALRRQLKNVRVMTAAALQEAFAERDQAEVEGFGNGWAEAMAQLESTRTVHLDLCVFRCNRCDWTDFPGPDGEPLPHSCAEHLQGDQSETFIPGPQTPTDPNGDDPK